MSVLEQRLRQIVFLCMCGFALTIEIKPAIPDTLTGIAILLGIVILMIKQKKSEPVSFRKNPYLRVIGIFFIAYFLLIFVSGDLIVGGKAYWRYFNRMFPFLAILFFVKNKKHLCILFFCAIAGLFLNNLCVIYNGVIWAMTGDAHIRSAGFNKDVIGTGGLLLIYLPILLSLMIKEKKSKRKYLYLMMFIAGIAALIFNATRIAWVAMIVVCISAILIHGKNIKKFTILFLLICLSIGIAGQHIPFVQDRIQSFTNTRDLSNQGHYSINHSAFSMIEDKPLLGWGLGQFPLVFNQQYITAETKKIEGHISHAHNDTLTMGAENGIVGIFVFWLMFGSFLFYSLKAWRQSGRVEDMMFFVVTLAAVIQGFTDTRFGMHAVNKLYFFLVAVYVNYKYSKDPYEETKF